MLDLDEVLRELEELLDKDPTTALRRFEALPASARGEAEVRFLLAAIRGAREEWHEARAVAEALVLEHPDEGDVHYLLADILARLGEENLSTAHFLRTLELDRLAHREIPRAESDALLDDVAQLLERTVGELPDDFREGLADVPLLVEELPSEYQVAQGLDPRVLGVFEGPNQASRGSPEVFPEPTRIILFAQNLAAEFPDPDEFTEQVRITVLHEIGHYFGLEEDDMERLGLA